MRELLPPEELPLFFSALEAFSARPRKAIRLSRRIGWGRGELEAEGVRLLGEVPWCPRAYFIDPASLPNPATHPLIGSGAAYLQEASAMELAGALDVRPGMRVLDLCAAPGGKTTQLLDALAGDGVVVANEVNRERVRKLDAMLARWGYLNLAVISRDTAAIGSGLAGEFDRVLVDAPCSSESFFAKRKDSRDDVSDRESAQFARMQASIVRDGFRALRPGGLLAYSTCTYSTAENEAIVAGLLSEFQDAELVRETRRWPHRDRVPGGFWALVRKGGAAKEANGPSMDEAESRARFTRLGGNVRTGDRNWNGERDEYAVAMSGGGDSLRTIDLDTVDARKFLDRQWSGDTSKETCLIRWRGLPIGRFTYGRGLKSYDFPRIL